VKTEPVFRGFLPAIAAKRDAGQLAVIAEVKRHSPSVGTLDYRLDAAEVAVAYEAGGATCLSVLTDAERFRGSPEDLAQARNACSLPVLRKDFIKTGLDVEESVSIGADAILLIAADHEQEELRDLHDLAFSYGLDILVEVHTHEDLEKALEIDPEAIGVNQRNLSTMELDPRIHGRLIEGIPTEIITVAESGVSNSDEARFLFDIGYDAVLVGTYLITAVSRVDAVKVLSMISAP
jgi:indole-3-glycerol phosphate synthase